MRVNNGYVIKDSIHIGDIEYVLGENEGEPSFTKGAPVMRMEADGNYGGGHHYGDLLFDLEADPKQEHPIENDAIKERMERLMVELMRENDAPAEQYECLGLQK